MLLSANRSQLLLVDMQERFMPALDAPEDARDTAIRLIQGAKELEVPVTYSEQYPKGLGPTVPELKEVLGNAPRFEKMHFSCAKDPALADHIRKLADEGRDQIVIAGVEAHVCVLQSAVDMSEMGLVPFVVRDAVTSRRADSVDLAAQRLETHGIEVVNSEMLFFEWMEKAGTPTFKTISALIK